MKKIILNLFLLNFIIVLSVTGRDVISFNDGWSFKKGPFTKSATLLTDDQVGGQWQEVTIPHTWNAKDMQTDLANMSWIRNPQERFYTGEAMYKKTYTPDSALIDKRIFLRFEGVGSVASVYVNNQYAGKHLGAYSAFAIEISSLLKYGEENEIIVLADNTPRPDVIPVNNVLFGVYGGIYRDINLIVTEKVNIAVDDYASAGIFISQKEVNSKSANVTIKTKIDNKTFRKQHINLVTTIFEMDGKTVKAKMESLVTLPTQGRQFLEQDFLIKKPHLWQGLEDPYLYKVVTQIVDDGQILDQIMQPLGLRHFELKTGEGMFLNGKKVPMYGTCRHQDWWELGSALKKEHHDKDLEIIKEMGATTIRLAHYQQAEYIYAKCDSIGFIVWAEIPFVNSVSTLETENAKQQLTELIRQNYNHPSIYVWGLHNEVYKPFQQTIPLTTTLHDLAKTEDPYRYTISVSGYNAIDATANNNADIQGINHYFGWYGGKIGDIKDWAEKIEKEFPDHNVMFSEYGGEANIYQQKEDVGEIGDCCGFDKKYYETFGTKFHEIQWGIISQHPYILASYIWNTFDFGTPLSSQGGIHSRNMKGLVTFDRKTKKDPFYWYKANWSKEPVLYLTQRRADQRENENTSVTVYSNTGTPRLYINNTEVTDFSKGTTPVHYIFNVVKLKEGENIIEVKANDNGQELSDKIIWYYSPENKKSASSEQPKERTEEHIGL
ncbi:beta-galactosidase [Dysgonomonas hofstadii]|uniref:Beta-galactosidase n=1 Tax=Dysgonomonas hofstadii TaxID=637886 RepID=A0A840CGD7_9BACT|nr:glycoside hydrolase family 2 TIM barrel-domain containing protein [Dysgonomonas hofstadii]MBB4034246.1 beta-galactosidase [Dysgonomonas hofstadii]